MVGFPSLDRNEGVVDLGVGYFGCELALRRCPEDKDGDVWKELDSSAKTLYSTERFILHFMTIHAQKNFRFDVDNIVGPKKPGPGIILSVGLQVMLYQ